MRLILATAFLACLSTAASAGEPLADGPVAAGSFGMSGADYYGDTHSHMPFTDDEAPRPIGMADLGRVRAVRGRADAPSRKPARHGRAHHG